MKNISMMATRPQVEAEIKDVTRRLGWLTLRSGEYLRAVDKCMGFKKGETPTQLKIIQTVDVRREPLRRMIDEPEYGDREATREGFPDMSGIEFVNFYCNTFRVKPARLVTRIEFIYIAHYTPATGKVPKIGRNRTETGQGELFEG